MSGGRKRVPQEGALQSRPNKTPHHIPGSTRAIDDHIAWRFELIYGEPCFGWDTLTADDQNLLHKSLAKFEGMTIGELFNNSGHPGKTYGSPHAIPNLAARRRLLKHYEDEDAIHRLQCDGKHRIFGFRRGNVFLVLWWDPNHDIWPSKKKHT